MAGEVSKRRIGYAPGIIQGTATTGGSEKDDDKRLVDDALEKFRNSARTSDTWRASTVEDYQYVSGEQWSDADLKALDNEQLGVHRPHLVINKMLGPILFLSSMHRQSRVDPTLLPPRGGSNEAAELMRALLKRISQLSREPSKDNKIFLDKSVCGLGYKKVVMNYDDDPDGMPWWECRHPLCIFGDPNWFDGGWDAAEYVFDATWQTKEQAQDAHPDFAEEIGKQYGEWLSETSTRFGADAGTAEGAGDSWSGERLFWDPTTQRIRVLEYWYKRRLEVSVVVNKITGEASGDPDKVKALRERLRVMPQAKADFDFVKRPVIKIRKAEILNNLLLGDDESPFDAPKFPIFPTVGYYFWQNPFGIAKPMKPLQQELNRRRSTIIEMIQSMPVGGFFNKKLGGAKSEDIKKFSDGSTSEIPYEDVAPSPIRPPELPQTLVYLDTMSSKEISDVVSMTGIAPSKPGYTTSSKHVESLQRPSVVTQDHMVRGFWEDMEPAVDFMVRVIQQYMPKGKALQILQVMAQREQPAQPMQPGQPPQPGKLTGMMQQPGFDVMATLEEAMTTRYEVTFDPTKPWEPSLQAAAFETLSEFAKEFPGEIPPEVLVDAAKDNGLLSADQGAKILAWIQQRMEQAQAAPGAASRGR